jgi:hypothetical protein
LWTAQGAQPAPYPRPGHRSVRTTPGTWRQSRRIRCLGGPAARYGGLSLPGFRCWCSRDGSSHPRSASRVPACLLLLVGYVMDDAAATVTLPATHWTAGTPSPRTREGRVTQCLSAVPSSAVEPNAGSSLRRHPAVNAPNMSPALPLCARRGTRPASADERPPDSS